MGALPPRMLRSDLDLIEVQSLSSRSSLNTEDGSLTSMPSLPERHLNRRSTKHHDESGSISASRGGDRPGAGRKPVRLHRGAVSRDDRPEVYPSFSRHLARLGALEPAPTEAETGCSNVAESLTEQRWPVRSLGAQDSPSSKRPAPMQCWPMSFHPDVSRSSSSF